MPTIEKLVEDASHDMFNPKLNFEIAKKYEEMGQTASAISFYLRAAEYGHDTDPLVVYASILRMSICFDSQREREHTTKHCLLQAIQYLPNRPEAYFLLSRYYERKQDWQECYTWAEVGLTHNSRLEALPIDVEYYGLYCLEFEKGVSGWWLGRKEDSKQIFEKLLTQDINLTYKSSVEYNLQKL